MSASFVKALGSVVAALFVLGAPGAAAQGTAGAVDLLAAAAVQPDGKMVLAGSTDEGDRTKPRRILLVRYRADGMFDPSFGSQGRVTTALGDSSSSAATVAVQPDGRIVVGGAALIRYLPDGSLDPSFGTGGMAMLRVGVEHLALQADGRIVAAVWNPAVSGFQLRRYDSHGALDTGFGTDGVVTVHEVLGVSRDSPAVRGLLTDPDGRIVLAGTTRREGREQGVVARFLPNGDLDQSFGFGGVVISPVSAAIAIQLDGKIVAAGGAAPGAPALAVARYEQDGSIDRSFGDGGIATALVPRDTSGFVVVGVAVQADGNILVGGGTLARFRPNGKLDTSFSGGFVGRYIGGDRSPTLLIQNDGRIVFPLTSAFVGPCCRGELHPGTFYLRRYLPDGTLEPGFPTPWGRQNPSQPDVYRLDLRSGRQTNLTRNLAIDGAPAVSPDGRTIAFLSWRSGQPGIYGMKPDGSAPRLLAPNRVAPGFRIADFDWGQRTTIAWSPDGRRIAFDTLGTQRVDCLFCPATWSVWMMNADGSGRRLIALDARAPSWSPDGRSIAFESDIVYTAYGNSVEVIRADGSNRQRVARGSLPTWSPRGRSIAYVVYRKRSPFEVAIVNADGTGRRHVAGKGWKPFWSPDGRSLAFYDSHDALNGDISVVDARRGLAKHLRRTAGGADAKWSPNGAWIAVNYETRIQLVDPRGKRRRVVAKAGEGRFPGRISWSADGRSLFFTLLPPDAVP
jgi:uncharacterized delta-60 repeat protein